MNAPNAADNPGAVAMDDATTTSTRPSAPSDAPLRNYQLAYLLQQAQDAPGQQIARGVANRFPRAVARELSLTPGEANDLRDDLSAKGYLKVGDKAGSVVYELTDAGRAYLETLPRKDLPIAKATPAQREVPEAMRDFCRTYLLLQLFQAPGHELDQKQANRFDKLGRALGLRAPAANQLRKELARQGFIDLVKDGRNVTLRLSASGRQELGTRSKFPEQPILIHGRVLMELLEAARDAARDFLPQSTTEPSRPATTPTPRPEPAHSGV